MKISPVIFPFAIFACAACNKAPNRTAGPPINIQPQVETIPLPPIPVATAVAIDPEAEHRTQLLGHINTLTNDDCDALVLLFQIIPRDEILNPLSEPKKDLLRYVKRIASADELDAIERAIKERNRLSAEEPGTISRAQRGLSRSRDSSSVHQLTPGK